MSYAFRANGGNIYILSVIKQNFNFQKTNEFVKVFFSATDKINSFLSTEFSLKVTKEIVLALCLGRHTFDLVFFQPSGKKD